MITVYKLNSTACYLPVNKYRWAELPRHLREMILGRWLMDKDDQMTYSPSEVSSTSPDIAISSFIESAFDWAGDMTCFELDEEALVKSFNDNRFWINCYEMLLRFDYPVDVGAGDTRYDTQTFMQNRIELAKSYSRILNDTFEYRPSPILPKLQLDYHNVGEVISLEYDLGSLGSKYRVLKIDNQENRYLLTPLAVAKPVYTYNWHNFIPYPIIQNVPADEPRSW